MSDDTKVRTVPRGEFDYGPATRTHIEIDQTTGRGRVVSEVELDPSTGRVKPESMAAADDALFYCPACGRRYNYQRECTGRPGTGNHPPTDVVSTDELKGDSEGHTAAPNTDRLG